MNKNFEKYNTAEERIEAFNQFCIRHQCADCPLCHFHETAGCHSFCAVAWLDLEAKEEEKALPCPFCGGEMMPFSDEYGFGFICSTTKCGATSCRYDTREEAVAAHNRVARAVMDAKNAKKDGETDGSK